LKVLEAYALFTWCQKLVWAVIVDGHMGSPFNIFHFFLNFNVFNYLSMIWREITKYNGYEYGKIIIF
jgi:hypothetical protein